MVRTQPKLPTHSMAKESVMVRGKRSGTYVNTKDVEQDASGKDKMEDFFGAATEEPTPQSQRVKTRRKKRSSRLAAKPRTPKSTVPMQLPGADQEDSDLNSEQALNYTQSYVAKLKSTKSIQSPSELSAVSTAPPTPHDPAVEAPRFADEEQEERLHTQEELVVPQAASLGNEKILSVENPPQPIDGSQDPNFPPMGLEDDDNLAPAGHSEDEFDMGPAAHSDDDEEVDDTKPKAAETTSETESDFDNDEDKEGTGFNIVHDPETPASVRKRRMQKEKAEIEKRRKNKKRSSSSTSSNSGDSSQGDEEHTPVRKQTKRKKKQRHVVFSPQGIPMANRDYNPIPVENFVEVDEDEEGFRRSRRAKCKPLAYWKNEKFEYGPNGEIGELGEAMGDMPVVVNVVKALPTPYKKKTTTSKRKVNTKKQKQEKEEAEAFDNHKIVKKYKDKVIEGEHADLWDDAADDVVTLKVVSYAKNLESSALPVGKDRTKEEGKVAGLASQGFNIPNDDNDNYVGYIMGNLLLPPRGIKDAESVGPCSQTFTVCTGQPNALEVSFGDPDLPEGQLDRDTAQRFFLGPGDLFRVPPGNCYRLHNHSRSHECLLTWTIIRPRHIANDGA